MKEAFWIIDQLVEQGVRFFCISPGSRSTPLAIAAAENKRAKIFVHYDERGIGFFALGIAKAIQSPVAVIVTSGSALGNLMPSVMEAHHGLVPLLLLTADRPPELNGCGANQATEQTHFFHSFVRWQITLPPSLDEIYFRSCMAHAYYFAQKKPPGPVHLNVQLREPLYAPSPSIHPGKPISLGFPRETLDPALAKQWEKKQRGVFVIGKVPKEEDLKAILKLAKKLQWPIFADLLSQARLEKTEEQIRHFDWILKTQKTPKPDLILHFGERLISKKILDWMKESPVVHISPFPFIQDAARTGAAKMQTEIPSFCESFEAERDPDWFPLWKERDSWIDTQIQEVFQRSDFLTEAHAMHTLSQIFPKEAALFCGNSMPIRDADHFFSPNQAKAIFANRGLSGIDGNIATAAGIAEGLQSPLIAWIGDQACLHDLSSLPLLKKGNSPIYLLISNNFGGGIFSHLPVSQSPHLERLFAAAHPWSFEKAAQMFDVPYQKVDRLEANLFQGNETKIIELVSDRKQNYRFQKELFEACLRTPF